MLRIAHVITGLEAGGAEQQLVGVASHLDRAKFEPVVVSLTDRGPLATPLEAAGVPVHAVRFHRSLPDPVAFARLVTLLRRLQPDLIETWLYKADLLGGFANRLAGRAPLLWSVHQTNLAATRGLRSNVAAARVGARLSRRLPTLVLCVSQEAADAHQAMGYAADKLRVVPNGFDTDRFHPDPEARARIRSELGWDDSVPVVGLVARFDPQKDHATFAAAARLVADRVPAARFLLCGRDIDAGNTELTAMLAARGISDRVVLLGVRHDMPAVTAAFDVATSSSAFGEAFSIAIGEAMATGVSCVATNSGNAATLVGDTGRVVSTRDPAALADGIIEMLAADDRDARGARARELIVDRYSLAATVRRYEETYDELLRLHGSRDRRRPPTRTGRSERSKSSRSPRLSP
jgi:glycosyltransferase involved in cell wall biosynthesis